MVILGSIIAWVAVALGALRAAMGFYVAFSFSGDTNVAASARYLGTANSGEAINEGMVVFVVGVVIGLLVEIAKKGTTAKET